MAQKITLYARVVDITYVYLGPAADRFISRQIRNHLNKQPDDLAKKDLAELIDWLRIALALLTDDQKLVSRYANDLQQLTKSHSESLALDGNSPRKR